MRIDRSRLAVACAAFAAFTNLYATQAILPIFRARFEAGIGAVNLTVTAAMLTVALLAPFTGLISDAIGRRPPIVVAALLLTLPTLGIALAPDLATIVICRFAQGMLVPFIFSATVAYIGEEWTMPATGEVMALYISGSILGGLVGRLATGVAAGLVGGLDGWRWGFVVLAMLNLLAALVVWRCLPRSKHFRPSTRIAQMTSGLAAHLHNPRLLATFAIGASLLFVPAGLFTFATHYLSEAPFELGPTALGLLFLVYIPGALTTRQSTALARKVGRKRAVAIAMGIGIAGSLMSLAANLAIIVVGFTLVATGMFLTQTIATTYISISSTTAKSLAAGLYVAAYYFGGSMAPVLLTPVWQALGWTGCIAVLIAAQLMVIGLAARFWVDDTPNAVML
jgi:predicted MFS family arabinose efflux permease